jgi:hypothetical protein
MKTFISEIKIQVLKYNRCKTQILPFISICFCTRSIFTLLFSTLFFSSFGQSGYFQFNGSIIDQNKKVPDNAKIIVYEGAKSIDSMKISRAGTFSLKLKLNNIYFVVTNKKGYTSKKIFIDTNVPDGNEKNTFILHTVIAIAAVEKTGGTQKNNKPDIKFFYDTERNAFVTKDGIISSYEVKPVVSGAITSTQNNNKSNDELVGEIEQLKNELNNVQKELDVYKLNANNSGTFKNTYKNLVNKQLPDSAKKKSIPFVDRLED